MTNYSLDHYDQHPLYQVLGSVSMALLILNEEESFTKLEYDPETLSDIGSFSERLAGTYTSALGDFVLCAEGDRLTGTVAGHDVTLSRGGSLPDYVIQTDFEPLDGVRVSISAGKIIILRRQFAYR